VKQFTFRLPIFYARQNFNILINKKTLNDLIMKNQFSKLTFSKQAFIFISILVFFSACAKVTDVQACVTDEPYGFLFGLWHGIIAPLSFFGSLFSDSIAMYAVNNNGGWYDFGFVVGAGILLGGSSRASKRR
jgi:hypothetical protein